MKNLILTSALTVLFFAAAVRGAPITPSPQFSPQQRAAFDSMVERMRVTKDPAKRRALLENYRNSLTSPVQPTAPTAQHRPAPAQRPTTATAGNYPGGAATPRGYPPPPPTANYGYGAMPYYPPPPPYMGAPYPGPAQPAPTGSKKGKNWRGKHRKAVLKELRNISVLLERIAVALEGGVQPSLEKSRP